MGEPSAHYNQRPSPLALAAVYFAQAVLSTVAILACLVGIKTLPLCYVIGSLNITHLAFTSIEKLSHGKVTDTHSMLQLILSMVTVVCAISSVQLIDQPEARTAPISNPGLHDQLI